MTRKTLYWIRLLLGHDLEIPFHAVGSRFPKLEFGLSSFHLSRITCQYPPLAGRRGIQISDLHLDRYLPRHDLALHTIADLTPDWIFVTGDLLNLSDGLPHLFRFLSRLREIAPVFIILGNHDHFSGIPIDRFRETADRHKITLLINEITCIPVPRGELCIVGLDDPTTDRADLRCIPQSSSNRFTLLLAHAPNILDSLNHEHPIDLILCGHSHGGQWYFPGIKPFWLPPGCGGRTQGEYVQNGHRLYVNQGMGWTLLPIRINCKPEILTIDWEE